jgi:hypothetical protein
MPVHAKVKKDLWNSTQYQVKTFKKASVLYCRRVQVVFTL